MMETQYSRLERLIGREALDRLRHARVAVFGLGGVGGNAAEALARSDTVNLSNINRQVFATHSSIGRRKVDVAGERIHDIDPTITVNKYCCFYLPEPIKAVAPMDASSRQDRQEGGEQAGRIPMGASSPHTAEDEAPAPHVSRARELPGPPAPRFDFSEWDYVIDAIDTVTGKIGIILEAQKAGTPVISCMGCGNRLDPARLVLCDIYETRTDPLARVMRRELRRRGVAALRVVCSTEPAIRPVSGSSSSSVSNEISGSVHGSASDASPDTVPGSVPDSTSDAVPDSVHDSSPGAASTPVPGSTAFVPPAAGLLAASVVVRELAGIQNE